MVLSLSFYQCLAYIASSHVCIDLHGFPECLWLCHQSLVCGFACCSFFMPVSSFIVLLQCSYILSPYFLCVCFSSVVALDISRCLPPSDACVFSSACSWVSSRSISVCVSQSLVLQRRATLVVLVKLVAPPVPASVGWSHLGFL